MFVKQYAEGEPDEPFTAPVPEPDIYHVWFAELLGVSRTLVIVALGVAGIVFVTALAFVAVLVLAALFVRWALDPSRRPTLDPPLRE